MPGMELHWRMSARPKPGTPDLGQMLSFTNGRYQVIGCQNGSADVPATSSTIATLCLALVTAT